MSPEIPPVPTDPRLVVTDMDGTLLDGDKRIPSTLWPLLEELDRRGVVFSPASGRQAATLVHQLGPAAHGTVVIAENGAVVVRDGELLAVTTLDAAVVPAVLACVRALRADGADVGVVLCAADRAFVERSDARFMAQVQPYYVAHEIVDDLDRVEGPFVKVAVYDFDGVEATTAPAVSALGGAMDVLVSGAHWLDVMAPGVDKAVAVRRVQERLGVTPAQTMVFGDYLNDLAMLGAADWSYAVANAHPDVLAAARFVAPSNLEDGVVRTLSAALGLPAAG